MDRQVPHFDYFRDPVGAEVLVWGVRRCPVYGEVEGWHYVGPIFAPEEHDSVSVRALTDGSAAEALGGFFVEWSLAAPVGVDWEVVRRRAPGFYSAQRGTWPVIAGDPGVFCGVVEPGFLAGVSVDRCLGFLEAGLVSRLSEDHARLILLEYNDGVADCEIYEFQALGGGGDPVWVLQLY